MQGDFEVIHRRSNQPDVVLTRIVPKKLRDRWNLTEQYARMVLRGRVQKSMTENGFRHAFISPEHPEDGVVGIMEKK